MPWILLAEHWYMPSCSWALALSMVRKFLLTLIPLVSDGVNILPFLYQAYVGAGFPPAWHRQVNWEPSSICCACNGSRKYGFAEVKACEINSLYCVIWHISFIRHCFILLIFVNIFSLSVKLNTRERNDCLLPESLLHLVWCHTKYCAILLFFVLGITSLSYWNNTADTVV